MASINGILDLMGKLQSPGITVHQERCVLVRNRNADCLRCAEACTSGCISYDGEALTVSPERCIACGTCATVCPTCALEARHPTDAELMAACRSAAEAGEGAVVIGCGELLDRARGRYDERKVVRVECLGRVDESLLVGCAADGVETVALAHGDCAACEHATGRACAEAVCATVRTLLEAWDAPLAVKLTAKLPAATRREGGTVAEQEARRGAERRDLLQRGSREAARVGAVVAESVAEDALGAVGLGSGAAGGTEGKAGETSPRYTKVMADGTLPHFIPDRRERLLDALAELGEPADVMVDTRLWGHVVIDPAACTSCQMCATFCPTGALRKFQDPDGTFGVEHGPADCAKCRLCASICPAGAIEISEEVFARDLLRGMTDRYAMAPRPVQHDTPHAIWHTMRLKMKTDQVYER